MTEQQQPYGEFPLVDEKMARIKRLKDEINKINNTMYSAEYMEVKLVMIKALMERIDFIIECGCDE